MKQRNVIFVILISIITFGIYTLVWLFKTRNELRKTTGVDIPSGWLWLGPILGMVIPLLVMISASATLDNDSTAGLTVIMLLSTLLLFGLYAASMGLLVWWLWRYSQAVAVVTKGRMSRDTSFWVAILCGIFSLPFVWQAVLQDEFNHVATQTNHSAA